MVWFVGLVVVFFVVVWFGLVFFISPVREEGDFLQVLGLSFYFAWKVQFLTVVSYKKKIENNVLRFPFLLNSEEYFRE